MGLAQVAACEYDPDHAAGYAARIRAATSHTRLFDRMASVRDWEGCPTAMTRSDFMRARLFCLMLPSGSLSAVPDATDAGMSAATRETLARIGDADGRVSWTEYLILSALLSAPARELAVALASGDEDGSGSLSHTELCRSLAFLVESELVASGDDLREASADRWCAAAAAPSSSDPPSEESRVPGSREVRPPLGVVRAALAPVASEIPPDPTPEQLAADRYSPAAILSLADALRRAVAELEFRVFLDGSSDRSRLPSAASGATDASQARRMSPAAFARFIVCQSHAGPSSMAAMLQAWSQRVGSEADPQQPAAAAATAAPPLSGAGAVAAADAPAGVPGGETASTPGGGSRARDPRARFESLDPRDSLSFDEFLGVRAAMVDRSGQVVASLRMSAAAAGSATVTPQMLAQAVWAVSGADLPRAAAEAVLAVAAPGRPGHEASAPLESVATLLAEHAAASVGRRRAAGQGGFVACVRGDGADGRA
ncbi:hypothetical protein FNF28_05150 [Cafeteria roenbergensis]|uniref:Uncharacterized protein n=1 Tax=Cafeteria roenbergensis TaxID=33653 RepID=A0A5A8DBB1_CAFRO|nr:hypothetical protein FNF28_05150 [Cafeteria roenbergensis]